MNQLLLSRSSPSATLPHGPPGFHPLHPLLSSPTTSIPPLLSSPPPLSVSPLSLRVLFTLVNSALKFSANVKVREAERFVPLCVRAASRRIVPRRDPPPSLPPPSVGISLTKNITRYGNRGRVVPRVSVRRVDEYFEVISSRSVGRRSPPRGQIKEVADA